MINPARATALLLVLVICASSGFADADYAIKLRTGTFVPPQAASRNLNLAAGLVNRHVLVQFDAPVTEGDRQFLKAAGLELLDYIPENSWIARVTRLPQQSELRARGVRWLGEIAAQQKLSNRLTDYPILPSARRGGDRVQFVVVLQRDEDAHAWAENFKNQFDASIVGIEPTTNALDIILPEAAYHRIAELDAVQWIEPALPEPEEHNNSCRDNLNVTTVQAPPLSLTGLYVMVAEWDGGGVATSHADFSGRAAVIDGSLPATHATHVAGTVIGNGARSSGTYKGMAPEASLVSQLWWNSGSEAQSEYQNVTSMYGANLATNSWGYGVGNPATQGNCEATMGDYYDVCATLDNIVRGNPGLPISICWSAGNERGSNPDYCGSIGWTYNTVTPPGTAKNTITVGAVNSNNSTMTSFSSWGPTDDGRIKPDVVGPGCQTGGDGGVTSCNTSNGYTTMCGTSMSTPAVAGVVALLYQQRYLKTHSFYILPSTIRGILINSATDLGPTGPDYQYGHGLVDAAKAVKKMAIGDPSWVEGQLTTGSSTQYDLVVPGNMERLRATLAWDDPAPTLLSGPTLVNDLDVTLIDPFGVETKAWILNPASPASPATRGVDRINNVETAEVIAPIGGLWKVRVSGYNVPVGPQKYSLILTPDSIYQSGNLRSMQIYGMHDTTITAGSTTVLDFWVTNMGGAPDSIRTRITETKGWLSSTADTSVLLAPYDSVHIVRTVTIPALSLYGDSTIVTCRANSISDTSIVAVDKVAIRTAAVYDIAVDQPPLDTVRSPEDYAITLKVRNRGNTVNPVDVTASSGDNWLISPSFRSLVLNPHDSNTVTFTASIPEEVAHQSTHVLVFRATGRDNTVDTVNLSLYVNNPVFPPTLVSPDTILYTKNRRPTFSWSGAGDSYKVLLGTDTTMTTVLKSYSGITGTSFTIPSGDSLADGQYFWAVKKYVSGDSSSVQRYPRRLVVDNIPPPALTNQAPLNGAILDNCFVTFSFSEPSDPGPGAAPQYGLLQVASDSLFSQNLTTVQPLTGNYYQLPDSLGDGRWYWRTRQVDLAGNSSPLSSAPTFIVDTKPPGLPTLTAPANGITTSHIPVHFKWTGTVSSGPVTSREYYYLNVASDSNFNLSLYSGYVYADSALLNSPPLVLGTRYFWRLKALDSAGHYSPYTIARSFKYGSFLCGDINASATGPDLSDLSTLISYLTTGSPSLPIPQAASFDCNTMIDLSDLSTLISYLLGSPISLCCPQ